MNSGKPVPKNAAPPLFLFLRLFFFFLVFFACIKLLCLCSQNGFVITTTNWNGEKTSSIEQCSF